MWQVNRSVECKQQVTQVIFSSCISLPWIADEKSATLGDLEGKTVENRH